VDVLDGGEGDDTFNAVGVGDRIAGGAGHKDTVNFNLSEATENLAFNLVEDEGFGATWTGVEFVNGTLGAGDDSVTVGMQLGVINGGEGTDSVTLDYSGVLADGRTATSLAFNGLNVTSNTSTASPVVHLSDDSSIKIAIYNFESFHITGTVGNDVINASTAGGGNTLYGGGGNDSLSGGTGADKISGGLGIDTISLGSGIDSIVGSLEELDGDRVSSFGLGDSVQVTGATALSASIVLDGSDTLLLLDEDGDGIIEATLLLAGISDIQSFSVTYADGNALLTASSNSNPIADPESFDVLEDGMLVIPVATLLEGDTDPDGDTLTVSGVSGALNGAVVLDDKGDTDTSNDEVIFTPSPGFVGETVFDYTIADGEGGSATAKVDVTVNAAPNVAPTAEAIDAGSVIEDGTVVSIDLLGDASAADSDGGTLGVSDVTATDGDGNAVVFGLAGAILTVNPALFAAALNTGDSTVLSIVYNVTDGQGGVTANSGTLLVSGLDGPFTWYLDGDVDGFGVDDVATNLNAYEAPAGTSDVAGDADDGDGTVYPGASEINDYKDNDQDGEIDEDNRDPMATAESFTVAENGTLVIPVASLLAGDTDMDGDALQVTGVSGGVNGSVVLDDKGDGDASNDEVVFTPTPGFDGEAVFDYTVADDFGGSASAAVDVTVNAALSVITGGAGADYLVGTDGSDVIISGAGSYDRMVGGSGADQFVFGEETLNGVRERDVIFDFEVGVDSIVLTDGTSVASIQQTSSGALVFLEGDGDAIYVLGDGITVDNLTIFDEAEFDFDFV
jgi:hypothetical protein